jgi:two-component system response regulator HydG
MQSPLALVLDDDPTVRERASAALSRSGIEALPVATPHEAIDLLRVHPQAVVVAVVGDTVAPAQRSILEELCLLRQQDGAEPRRRRIQGRSDASQALRQRVQELAGVTGPVLFSGEAGSGRRYGARCLHELGSGSEPFAVVEPADRAALDAALAARGTVFIASLDNVSWPLQEALAAALKGQMVRPRLMASIGTDPRKAADEGRFSPALLAAFDGSVVPVPALRDRRSDIAMLVKSFVEELRQLNHLAAITVAPEVFGLLEEYAWPGNVGQLRHAVESAVIVAAEGTITAKDLPDFVRSQGRADGPAARRFRDAKRSVVETFERAYLEDLLRRHSGNVTGAAETSGMLRSALQRLLRKHALHSADYRLRAPGPSGT